MTNAKLVRPIGTEQEHVRIKIVCDDGCYVRLVRGGKRRAYLWIGDKTDTMLDTISGEKALRALARAILDELKRD